MNAPVAFRGWAPCHILVAQEFNEPPGGARTGSYQRIPHPVGCPMEKSARRCVWKCAGIMNDVSQLRTNFASLGQGDPAITVAVLDGPVDVTHGCFRGAYLRSLETIASATAADGGASAHGTHVASLIFGQPGSLVEGLAPRCRGLIVPVFGDDSLRCSQLELARAILLAIENGAHVINISGGELATSGEPHPILAQAIQSCIRQNVLIVAAAGNDGCDCLHIPAAVDSVMAVGAMDEQGRPLPSSNWGSAYRGQGILAPGSNIQGATLQGGIALKSGTSFAAPLVFGFAALLLCHQIKHGSPPDPRAVREALLKTAIPCIPSGAEECSRILAGRINVQGAIDYIQRGVENMSETANRLLSQVGLTTSEVHGDEPTTISARAVSIEAPGITMSDLSPSDCGCGCGHEKKASCACGTAENTPQTPQLVYAIGTLNWDFGSATREDSFRQAMSDPNAPPGRQQPSPRNLDDLIGFLNTDGNASYAQALIWTLTLDATPIYAIQPSGPFAADAYKVLIAILADKTAPLASVPGYIAGNVRLQSGQQVPAIVPAVRGLLNWNVDALAVHALGKPPTESRPAKDREAYAKKLTTLKDFASRIFFELRNLGIVPEDRALNFAATNAAQAARVIDDATSKNLSLDSIKVFRSAVCRPGSDCFDVDVTFFDPTNMNVANTIYRFTLDVSDVIPVSVGEMRSWTKRN